MSSSLDNGFTYLPYAIKNFGFFEGIKRTWEHYASPTAQYHKLRRRIRQYQLVDRREKKSWSRAVYCMDRDGDLYLIECPMCNNTQSLWCHRPWDILTEEQRTSGQRDAFCDTCGTMRRTHFHCSRCSLGFDVHLEDGLHKVEDHRDGVPPLPTKAVQDDGGKWHLGIDKDAPWWWTRREVERDFNPATGKDAHGHEHYLAYPNPFQSCGGGMQCEQAKNKS